jgi:hypothetical protein
MIELLANADATEIDVNGMIDEATGIEYIGKATKTFDGHWLCLANVGGSLCRVELTVRPAVIVDADAGDEDDRGERDRRRDRDLLRPVDRQAILR